jgi:hypothetical protein
MVNWLLSLTCICLLTQSLQAHFLWLIPGEKPNTVKLVFSDKLAPDADNPGLIDPVKHAGLYVNDQQGKRIDLKLENVSAALLATFPEKSPVVRGSCTYGVFQRGDNPPALLNYYCIYQQGELKESACFNCQPFQVRESGPGEFLVEFDGAPAKESEVVLVGPDGFKEQQGKTDKSGKVAFDLKNAPPGLYGLRAKHVVSESGEHKGKKYSQITNYVTLVFQMKSQEPESGSENIKK